MSSSSGRELPNGWTVLVTGGTGGIGYQTARVLARRGARLVITGRETGAGERAVAAIRRESGQQSVSFLHADHPLSPATGCWPSRSGGDFPT